MKQSLISKIKKDYSSPSFLLTLSLAFLFFLFFFSVGFFSSLKGRNQVLVPKVQGSPLAEGILKLQQRKLLPLIRLRFTSSPKDRGLIMEQDPSPGENVREGRQIKLLVSKGAIISRVDDYKGRNLDKVRRQLQELFIAQKAILKVSDHVQYVFSDEPEGTVLAQTPAPGTPVAGETELVLTVSRGTKTKQIPVKNYTGLHYDEALKQLTQSGTPFIFSFDQYRGNGTVKAQVPAAGTVRSRSTILRLTLSRPPKDPNEETVLRIFDYIMPLYPVNVPLELLRYTRGVARPLVLMKMKYPGGEIGVPYRASSGDRIVLKVLDKVVGSRDIP